MNETDILSRMDDSKITKQHWKIMFISGMGFFTDAYDLFIIGAVISILKDEWHPSPWAGTYGWAFVNPIRKTVVQFNDHRVVSGGRAVDVTRPTGREMGATRPSESI